MKHAIHEAYLRFLRADAAWTWQIMASLKGRPGDVRYTKAAHGEPGTALCAAHREFAEAGEAWRKLIEQERSNANV